MSFSLLLPLLIVPVASLAYIFEQIQTSFHQNYISSCQIMEKRLKPLPRRSLLQRVSPTSAVSNDAAHFSTNTDSVNLPRPAPSSRSEKASLSQRLSGVDVVSTRPWKSSSKCLTTSTPPEFKQLSADETMSQPVRKRKLIERIGEAPLQKRRKEGREDPEQIQSLKTRMSQAQSGPKPLIHPSFQTARQFLRRPQKCRQRHFVHARVPAISTERMAQRRPLEIRRPREGTRLRTYNRA